MRRFTNPLDNVRIASPCSSDWNHMYGDERRRFCSECKLNVYNLSDMTRFEAENLLMNAEGRLCVRFFRRKDGTILTRDCPIGWKAIRARAVKTAAAISSLIIGFFGGLLTMRVADAAVSILPVGEVSATELQIVQIDLLPVAGEVENITEWEGKVDLGDLRQTKFRVKTARYQVGRLEKIEKLGEKKVVAWIK